jgi:hypothetical protein
MDRIPLTPQEDQVDFDALESELLQRGIPPYSQLPVTTMVALSTFSGQIDLNIANHMLPVVVTELKKKIRSKKKFAIDHYPIPGSILFKDYHGQKAGLVNTTAKQMKYEIALVMSINDKNITCKLYPDKLHMTGCKSLDHARETTSYILHHVYKIQRILKLINSDEEGAEKIIRGVSKAVAGEVHSRVTETVVGDTIYTLNEQYISVNQSPITLDGVPPEYEEFVEYLLSLRQQFTTHSLLDAHYLSLLQISKLNSTTHPFITGTYECKHISSSMLNKNYSLGFAVDRENLNSIINGNCGFSSSFIHDLSAYVHIGLRYDPKTRTAITMDGNVIAAPQTESKKKKNGEHHNSILVWGTGQVTQSGPETSICRKAYILFMKIVSDFSEAIRS